ncbi:hypothetical protein [Chroococcus sp. FPU101]|uniref:hypothetical protein n=1 Tax=Chroococcus sp. FPU101 TaxID=1974212 RepID=UPI001A8C7807|nr:hypothetical protein [Chroococcus sp. FPU101]GFE70851.1 hypothetical protein CFPU101_34610 [Chroococcus sp. FPU101]
MKAEIYDPIKTLAPISTDGINFPEGTLGTVVEAYTNPEGYAVDLAIPDNKLVGGFRYYNVILKPEQFRLIKGLDLDEMQALSKQEIIRRIFTEFKREYDLIKI